MENIYTALRLLQPNNYMTVIDLKHAYYVVPIDPSYRKFLRFMWNEKIYEYRCMPFGLCTAPRIFTKIMKPVITHLRELGIVLVIYLDDILCIGRTFKICETHTAVIMDVLSSIGFVINREKSQLVPSISVKFLGFILNSKSFKLELPLEKALKAKQQILSIKSNKDLIVKILAETIGFLVSITPAVPYSMLRTKVLEKLKFRTLKRSNNNYNSIV